MFHTVLKRATMSVTRLRCISLSPLSRAMLVRASSTSETVTNGGTGTDSSTPSSSNTSKEVSFMKWICSLNSQMRNKDVTRTTMSCISDRVSSLDSSTNRGIKSGRCA